MLGDVSPCGRSGRWICGDSGVAQIRVADLRSGDGVIVYGGTKYKEELEILSRLVYNPKERCEEDDRGFS